MAADNNKNDKVRQLYKEDGASKIYPVVIKDSVSDGAGNYGANAFGTWFRETDMEVKSLSVCEDIKFWEETSTKDSFASVRVKDSSMFINMPLTIGMNNNGYSVKNLTAIAENTSIDSSVLTVTAKKTIVNSSLEITDASINKLTVKDSSFTGESTFNGIVTMESGLTVYATTDNTAINISTKGMGPHINITGADDDTGEMNVKNMCQGINLFKSDVAIYSDDSNVNYTQASITKNGYGKFNTLHIGPMDPENMYSPHLLNDDNWNSDNILTKPSDGSIVFSTTRFGFPGILSEENHIVAIDLNNKINVLRLNYPTLKTHSSVLMYDASVDNSLTVANNLTVNNNLKVDNNLTVANNLTVDNDLKVDNSLTVANNLKVGADLSVARDIKMNPKYGNIYLMHNGENKLRVTDSCVLVDASFLCVGLPNSQMRLSANSGGLIYSETNMCISAKEGDMNFILYSTNAKKFRFDYYNGGQHHNKFVIDESEATFTDEVKAKVNGVGDVYLGVPKYFITDWSTAVAVPAHWERMRKPTRIRYIGYCAYENIGAGSLTQEIWYSYIGEDQTGTHYKRKYRVYTQNSNNITLNNKAISYKKSNDEIHYFALYDNGGIMERYNTTYWLYISNIYKIIREFCEVTNVTTDFVLTYNMSGDYCINVSNLAKVRSNSPGEIEDISEKIIKVE